MSARTTPAPGEEKVVDEDTGTESTGETTDEVGAPSARSLGVTRPRVGISGIGSLGPRAWLVPAVLIVVAGLLAFVNLRHDGNADGAAEARKVVVTHVEELLSYDYREVEDELGREKDWLTGSFADDYQALVADKIAPAAVKAQVVTDAKVSASGIVHAGNDTVELLLFINVTTRSSELADARTVGSRLVVEAERADGAWRISSLQPV